MIRYRAGRKVGRTVYAQAYDEPTDADVLIGLMDTPELAALVVQALNEMVARRAEQEPR